MSENKTIDPKILERAKLWLDEKFDSATRKKVALLIEQNDNELIEAFYQNLEFGTGGLRGIMGPGTNRMNIYTISMASQGLCNYLKKIYPGEKIRFALAYDSRNSSGMFARKAAEVFASNDCDVYLFEALRPTPELSFLIREYGCHSGAVVTASHNPKEYNGFKVYWKDGSQLTPPHDKNVVDEVEKVKSISDVKSVYSESSINMVGKDIDQLYLKTLKSYSLSPDINNKHKDLSIVYTPIHGTGIVIIPECLSQFGFENVYVVDEQSTPDGNFPTVKSPNPEEPEALEIAIGHARRLNADMVMGTDPDSDRVGLAVPNLNGEFELLNGNQTGVLLMYYLIRRWSELGKINGSQYIARTIVTTEMTDSIAAKFGVESHNVLTGFKWIAELIRQLESDKEYIGGYEESYGYLIGNYVRDKDGVIAVALMAEVAAWAKEQGKSLFELLIDLYQEFGFYKEGMLSITRKGIEGAAEINRMMTNFRQNPPSIIDGSAVIKINDYSLRTSTDILSGKISEITLPKSNVLQFFTADGTVLSARPSGTEPKIKFYFGVKDKLTSRTDYTLVNSSLEAKINRLKEIVQTIPVN